MDLLRGGGDKGGGLLTSGWVTFYCVGAGRSIRRPWLELLGAAQHASHYSEWRL